jgi:hypothetical protein
MALPGIAVWMEKGESGKDVREAKEKLASTCYREVCGDLQNENVR